MIYVFTELSRHDDTAPRKVHFVHLPEVCEKGWYRAITSYEAFRQGRRAGATKLEKEQYRDRCCWSKNALFHGVRYKEWFERQEHNANYRTKSGEAILAVLDERLLTPIVHKDIWSFYKHIGFDHKKRRYIA